MLEVLGVDACNRDTDVWFLSVFIDFPNQIVHHLLFIASFMEIKGTKSLFF